MATAPRNIHGGSAPYKTRKRRSALMKATKQFGRRAPQKLRTFGKTGGSAAPMPTRRFGDPVKAMAFGNRHPRPDSGSRGYKRRRKIS